LEKKSLFAEKDEEGVDGIWKFEHHT
jgi:hypothetical protein